MNEGEKAGDEGRGDVGRTLALSEVEATGGSE